MDPFRLQTNVGGKGPRGDGGGDTGKPTELSWTMLLAHWTQLAQAAAVAPDDAPGRAWRASAADVVGLQALCMALQDLPRVPMEDHAFAIDRAEHQARGHAVALRGAWGQEPMPDGLLELLEDVQGALEGARWLGVEWCVEADHAGLFEMPSLDGVGGAEVLAAGEGTLLAPGSPAVFVRGGRVGVEVGVAGLVRSSGVVLPRQVYRSVDEGGVVDTVVPYLTELLPGRPLLVPMVEGARDVGAVAQWRSAQERALAGGALRLVIAGG